MAVTVPRGDGAESRGEAESASPSLTAGPRPTGRPGAAGLGASKQGRPLGGIQNKTGVDSGVSRSHSVPTRLVGADLGWQGFSDPKATWSSRRQASTYGPPAPIVLHFCASVGRTAAETTVSQPRSVRAADSPSGSREKAPRTGGPFSGEKAPRTGSPSSGEKAPRTSGPGAETKVRHIIRIRGPGPLAAWIRWNPFEHKGPTWLLRQPRTNSRDPRRNNARNTRLMAEAT